MSQSTVCGKITNFKTKGRGKVVLLLHGWGGNKDSFDSIFFDLSKDFFLLSLDFWGFGQSQAPTVPLDCFGYARNVLALIEQFGFEQVYVVGHSFGGRVAMALATMTHKVKKIVLVDSAGIKPRFSLKKFWKKRVYKAKKVLKMDVSKYGSDDFKALAPNMRQTFLKVVNTHIRKKHLKQIKVPTLLVWGREDTDTPLYMAKKIKKNTKDSGLIVFENIGHFSYLDKRFNRVVRCFLSGQ